MNRVDESFSALLDGEASELDIQRLLKAMDDQPEAVDRWQKLSSTQAKLQGYPQVQVPLSTVSEEQPAQPEGNSGARRWWQSGIAAAVALGVVMGVQTFSQPEVSSPVATVTVEAPANAAQLVEQQFLAQQRLDQYLREHAEQASLTTGHAIVPAQLEWLEAGQ